MAVPWLRILDIVLDVTDIARITRSRRAVDLEAQRLSSGTQALGHLEARLAGVAVAALKEVFDRDRHRLELEREQMEAERARAERALRLELLRQAGDREIGRLRLVAGIAVASGLGTIFYLARAVVPSGGAVGVRVAVGVGWVLLLAALSGALAAQSRVAAALDRVDEYAVVEPGLSGALAPWLLVAGLAVIGLAALVS
jgi:hypothetical protein